MSKTVELKINNFFGGVSDDPRKSSSNEFSITKHFDIFSQPNRLIPYRDLAADTNDGSTSTGMKQYQVKDFLYASTSAKLYGLGQNATGKAKIVYKADATTGNWTLPASSESGGAVFNGCLAEYKDYLWGITGAGVFKWGTISGGAGTMADVGGTSVAVTSVANGTIAKDDNLYLPYNNRITRVTSGLSVNADVLTIPSNFKIVSTFNYGNYLGIACAPISTFNGVSKIFLWNLTSPDVQEAIDWGEGELRVADTIEGMIVGVTDRYLNNAVGAGRGSLIIQVYSGGVPQVVKEVFTQALTNTPIPITKSIKNNRLFFAAKIMTNSAGTEYNEGIWSFGRKNVGYPYTLTLDVIDENVNTSGIQAFGTAGNFFFLAHSGDGSIDKTSATATYTFSSIYETQIYDFGEVDSDKTLNSVIVSFRKLLSGESVTVKYKVDDATSWTTIGSVSTTGEISRTFVNIESSGAEFASGKEYRFQFISTGGAEITGYRIKATVLDNI